MNQLESALVIALRDTIKWESAYETASGGTLTPLDPSLPFDPRTYQLRDRELAFRDLIVSAAVIEASVQVSDVYNFAALKPKMEGSVDYHLPFAGSNSGSVSSQVRHVLNTSIPWDAARYADIDLYGRDALAYEILSRACAAAFTEPAIPQLDSTGTVIPNTSVWSLASGTEARSDINPVLPLNRDLFKSADIHLTERDNQIAGYVANLVQVLKNPFEHALRIYVQVTVDGSISRESDVYALINDDGTNRVFQTEPALPNANQIIYDSAHKTLQWVREQVDEVHVPQIYALVIPGIDAGEYLQTIPKVPEIKDAQYWRNKASQIVPNGQSVTDVANIDFTITEQVTGGYTQVDAASLTVPGRMQIFTPELTSGRKRFNLLVNPNPIVEIGGARNVSDTNGTLGGVDYEVSVASGAIDSKIYAVDGGDGVIYASGTYLPGTTFSGISGTATYTQAGPITSTVRQAAVSWRLSLPPGAWSMQIQYADLEGDGDGFGIRADYTAAGQRPVEIAKDTVRLPVGGVSLYSTPDNLFDVTSSDEFTLNAYWTYGTGQLHIRKLIFRSNDNATGLFALNGSYTGALTAGTTTYANFQGQAYQPEVVRFETNVEVNIAPVGNLSGLRWEIPVIEELGPIHNATAGWCANPAPQMSQVSGDSGVTYDVTLHFRGAVELKHYVNSPIPGTGNYCVLGGAPAPGGANEYSFIVDNPSGTYWLNNTPAGSDPYVRAADFSIVVPINGQSKCWLIATAVDGVELKNGFYTDFSGSIYPIVYPGVAVVTSIGTTSGEVIYGQYMQMDVTDVTAEALPPSSSATKFELTAVTYEDLPLKVEQISVQSIGTFAATPLAGAFQGWRQECLDRAERMIQQTYVSTVTAYGTDVPTFRDSGSVWSRTATEDWMSLIEVGCPRLRQVDVIVYDAITTGRQYEVTNSPVIYDSGTYTGGQKFYGVDSETTYSGSVRQVGAFIKSQAGHVNRPCLVPRGIYFDDSGTSSVKAWLDTPLSIPEIVACQPWMIEQGFYVAQSDFWLPEYL